jgi:hypothetical protein
MPQTAKVLGAATDNAEIKNFFASNEFGRQRGPNSGKNADISYSEKKTL